jgi:hypothetical protein
VPLDLHAEVVEQPLNGCRWGSRSGSMYVCCVGQSFL